MKTSLVLEGGGMRGAYTAGCLAWLLDNGITFDSAYGISTGAVHLCSYLSENEDYLYDLSTNHIADKELVGIRSVLREGRIVGYDYLFNHILPVVKQYDITKAYNSDTTAKIGVYDLDLGKTVFYNLKDMDHTNYILKAATTLPILGRIVEYDGHKLLDGGITKMIPIEESVEDGNDKHLVICTKPEGFKRKKAKWIIRVLMRLNYLKYKCVYDDYCVRHINYEKQMELIKKLEDEGKVIYIYPSEQSEVSRLGGDKENLRKLYQLGKDDMERHREEIIRNFKK